MKVRRSRRVRGQSSILLALMIVVLIGFIGLSVDVGNAYGQQRRVQAAANAGALAAMGSVLANNTNNGVWSDVQRTLVGNRINATAPYSYRVDYVKTDGTVETLGEWNGSTSYVPNGSSAAPANIDRIQVTATEKVSTFFARVLGTSELPVSANGVACFGDYGFGVYPLGVPITLRPPAGTTPGHTVFLSNGTQLSSTDSRYGKWGSAMQGMTIRFPIAQGNDFIAGIHVPWLNWGGQDQTVNGVTYTSVPGANSASTLGAAWTYPGTLSNGFLEAISADSAKPNTKPMRKLQRGDWISGDPGVKATLKDQLDTMRTNRTDVVLPFYDVSNGTNGSNAAYHAVNFGHFNIANFDLTGSPKYIDLLYLGNATTAPQSCGSEVSASWRNPQGTPVLPSPGKQFNIAGQAQMTRVWRTGISSNTTSYDIVLVMDTSGSMARDWYERSYGDTGFQGSRINDAKQVVSDFVKGYDISAATGDPDARMAFVTFGGTTDAGNDPAVVRVNWTTACSLTAILTNCGGTSLKWPTIQSSANAMSASGYTPGPIAFEEVENLLRNKRTPPAGKKYAQVVVFATDGVFNVCGTDRGVQSCTYGKLSNANYVRDAGYNAVSGRPIWQAQQVAARIKNSGARIFLVAEQASCALNDSDCFDTTGMMDMSSGSGYYYSASDGSALSSIYGLIQDHIVNDTCVPHETTQPAANVTVVLTQPNNPTWSMSTTADSSGNYSFGRLPAGEYVLKVNPSPTVTSSEDYLARTYSRLRNSRNLSEEGQASIYINPQFPNGSTVYSQVMLSLPFADDGSLNNGCTMPAQQ